ncbi:dTDP-4-dehydrorhamnose 3,5-epimerase [Pseudomonas sp. F1_0610]|uniref:dTDP-4-dehydrorhamnose 3,5-epimerase n=1 Tax=Pseudomonas sp. F1_0610 TaxID=3114284 RepID=UPI0039C10844
MNIIQTKFPDVMLLEPKIFEDERGFFLESYQQHRYQAAGIQLPFVQDNMSRSYKGVLRGLHFQKSNPQGKLITVTQGLVFDVVVNINPNSEHFGQHCSFELSGDTQRQLWIPPGYAHGFYVLSDIAVFHYKCTAYYAPSDEAGIRWNDPQLGIDWPIVSAPLLSEKDAKLPLWCDLVQSLS